MSNPIIERLRAFYPEFWTRTLEDETLLDRLHEIYAMWYASAYANLVQIQNSYSIKDIDTFRYDYYSTIDCTDINRYTPTDRILYYENCFVVPDGVFYYEDLSYDSYFTDKVLDYKICYDKPTNVYFLAIHNREFATKSPITLFAQCVHNMYNPCPWQHFFDFKPLIYKRTPWVLVDGTRGVYNIPLMYNELEYIKAQYTNMMFVYTQGVTYDALDSLFAVAFRKAYAKRDGMVVDYSSTNVWINHAGTIVHYPVTLLKSKFRSNGAFVRQYEALENSDVELIDWNVNPAKFAQLMIGRGAKLYEQVIGLKPGERENSLVYNDLDLSWDAPDIPGTKNIRYDMGGQLWPDVVGYGIFHSRYYGGAPWLLACHWRRRQEELYSNLDYACSYHGATSYWWAPEQTSNQPIQRMWKEMFEPFSWDFPETGEQVVSHRYDYWIDIRYGHKFVYEMLRNIVIWQTELRSEYHPWINSVLRFFKLLHIKYIPSPMNGIAKRYPHGYGKVYRRHYGGILCITKHGYGNHHGRQYGRMVS